MLRALGAAAMWRHPAEGLAASCTWGSRAPWEGRGGTDKWSSARWAARFGSHAQTPGQDPREKRFGSDCGQSHAWGSGVRWVWALGRQNGEGMERLQPVPATSRVSGNVPRPGLVSAREPCQAVPAGSAAPGSPGGWAGLGGAAGAAGLSGGRAVSPQSSPGRSGRATLGVGVRGQGRRLVRRMLSAGAGRLGGLGAAWHLAAALQRVVSDTEEMERPVHSVEGGGRAESRASPAQPCQSLQAGEPEGGGLTSDPKPGRWLVRGLRCGRG